MPHEERAAANHTAQVQSLPRLLVSARGESRALPALSGAEAMSKASEWAANFGERPKVTAGVVYAEVANDGMCSIGHNGAMQRSLTPDDARMLARWILDTFGEPTP